MVWLKRNTNQTPPTTSATMNVWRTKSPNNNGGRHSRNFVAAAQKDDSKMLRQSPTKWIFFRMSSSRLLLLNRFALCVVIVGTVSFTICILLHVQVFRHLSFHIQSSKLYRMSEGGQEEENNNPNHSISAPWSLLSTAVQQQNTTTSTHISNTSARRLCHRDEVRFGKWQPVTVKAPPYITRTVHLRCHPEETYQQDYWNTYEWQPTSISSCVFASWNASGFCQLTRRATVLVIGDSLSWEIYRSLNHLLGNHKGLHQTDQHKSKKFHENIVQYVCPQHQTRLVFRRDDLLTNVTHAIFESGTFPQIIVMNRGAHYKPDDVLLDEMRIIIQEVKAWKEECVQRGVHCHFFWRTSVPGHPQCNHTEHSTLFSGPVNDLATIEAFIADRSHYNNRTIDYHWFHYQHQNILVEDLLKRELLGKEDDPDGSIVLTSSKHALEILDAYYLNVLRPDEHRAHQGDCLHNCYPGKIDVVSQLLWHYLQQQRTLDHVDELIAWQDQRFQPETGTNNNSRRSSSVTIDDAAYK